MEQIELTVQKRAVLGKQVRRLRREGLIPAVIYGHGVDPVAIEVNQRDLNTVLAQAGLSHLITLRLGGTETPRAALVREIQRDVLTDAVLHVDFLEVQMAEKLSTVVSLRLVGESRAVEDEGGVLLQGVTEVEIECLPGDLIDAIEVDISALEELEQELTVADLTVAPRIEILTEPYEMVARVILAPEEEEEEEEEILISPAEVEVIGRPLREEEIMEEEEVAEEERPGGEPL